MYATSCGIKITTLGSQYKLVTAFIIQTTDVNPTTVQNFCTGTSVRAWRRESSPRPVRTWPPWRRTTRRSDSTRLRPAAKRERNTKTETDNRKTPPVKKIDTKNQLELHPNFFLFLFLFLFIKKLFLTCLKTDNSLNPSF